MFSKALRYRDVKTQECLTLYHTRYLTKKSFENIVGKRENAGNQHFLLFSQCFLPFPKQISIFSVIFILLSANAFNLDQSKILSFGKELKELNVTAIPKFSKEN